MTGTMNISENYQSYGYYQASSKREEIQSFASAINAKAEKAEETKSQRGSVMEEYYIKHPEYKTLQEGRVKSGYGVLSSLGITADDIETLSMAEFQDVMKTAIGSISWDATRPYDEDMVNVSQEGWENMKRDPDYAAWVLGYIKADREVKNPFFGLGDMGAFDIRNIGASPEEYHGHMFSKIFGGTAAGARAMYHAAAGSGGIVTRAPHADAQPPADYNLWEERRKARKERQKELLEAEIQAKYQQRKRANELYERRYFDNLAWQKTLSVRRLLGDKMDTAAGKASMMDGMMAYDAGSLFSGSGLL